MLTCEDHVHKLNKKYRKKDKPTDILSFPYHKVTFYKTQCYCNVYL
jgi:rRNA maturation RNase YbeY